MAESIMQNTSTPISFTFLHRDMLKEIFTRPKSKHDSTDFSISRFLVPYLSDYKGWSLFVDNDMITLDDINEIFEMKDDKYAVMCTKHNQVVKKDTKFLGAEQSKYNMKNWSSVMLFNNAKCKNLTLDYVNTADGLDLHQFKWLDSLSDIGSIPLEWNYLIDNDNQVPKPHKLVHYTEGGPYFKETKDCEYSDDWFKIYNEINDVRSIK
jgi:hypothetical protein